jgi:low temperature requirement protein LtrA
MVGQRGVAKFPHAVALHGIQLFILAAVLARRSRLTEAARRRAVRLVVWSYAAVLVFASAQTITGNGPLDPTIWGAGLAVSVAGIVAGFLRVGRGLGASCAATEEQSRSMTAA